METIIGPAIGAAGAVIGSLVGLAGTLFGQAQRKRSEELERTVTGAAEAVEEEALRRYGFKVGTVISKHTLSDLDGKVSVERHFRGVTVTQPGVTLDSLPSRVWISSPGRLDGQPTLTDKPDFPKAVDLEIGDCTERRCEFRVAIAGGLTHTDPELDYGFRVSYSQAAYMTKEEMNAAYKGLRFKYEFHSFDVDFPMDKLEIQLAFPPGYFVQSLPAVFLGRSEDGILDTELKRQQDGFAPSATGAKFRITKPLLGFRYVIYWIPPTASEVDRLRNSASN